MIDIWFIFCMTIPFLEVCVMCCLSFPDNLRIMSQVLLQTYIESLRARIGQTFSVNHHGGVKTIKGDRDKVRHRETIS